MPCRRGGRAANRDDHVHAGRDELGRESREALLLRLRPAAHVGHVLLLNVAQVVQGLTQRQRRGAVGRSCAAREEADAPRLGARLRITVRRAGKHGEREQNEQYYARHHLRFFVLARFGALADLALAVPLLLAAAFPGLTLPFFALPFRGSSAVAGSGSAGAGPEASGASAVGNTGASPSGPSGVTMMECGRPSGPLSWPRIWSVLAPPVRLRAIFWSWFLSFSLGSFPPLSRAQASTTSSM